LRNCESLALCDRAVSEKWQTELAANYLDFIKLASIRVWLRAYQSMP
jgi:hypothetical protein